MYRIPTIFNGKSKVTEYNSPIVNDNLKMLGHLWKVTKTVCSYVW
jgi:hypothetical protein